MPVLLLTLFTRLGIPERFHKLAAIGSIIVLVLLAIGGVKLWFRHHDREVVAAHEAEIATRVAPASNAAASERAADTAALSSQEARLHAVISSAAASLPSGAPLPATTRALNCERLRRAHIDLPPACRS